jgi:hypothetical protein
MRLRITNLVSCLYFLEQLRLMVHELDFMISGGSRTYFLGGGG